MEISLSEKVVRKLFPKFSRRFDILVALHKKPIELVEKKMLEDLNG